MAIALYVFSGVSMQAERNWPTSVFCQRSSTQFSSVWRVGSSAGPMPWTSLDFDEAAAATQLARMQMKVMRNGQVFKPQRRDEYRDVSVASVVGGASVLASRRSAWNFRSSARGDARPT